MPLVQSQGLSIHYDVIGVGPPILLHHGVMGSGSRWQAIGYVDELADDFSLILVDARGHGQSDKPHDPLSYEGSALARDIVAVMDDLGLENIIFWGYSLGGRVGFELANIAAERFSAFIIGGSSPYEIDLRVPINGDQTDHDDVRSAVLDFFGISGESVPREYMNGVLENDFFAIHAALAKRPSIAQALKKMGMPCLLYVGEADPRSLPIEKAASMLKDASFARLPGLDHGQAFTMKDAVMPHVRSFLRLT